MIKVAFPVLLLASLLAGCATPVEKSEITPKFYPIAEKNVALSVVEARPYVLSGNKLPKFEGIIRGGMGIPYTIYRPNRPEEERFVDLLAGMIRDGLSEAGVNVTVVAMPLGATAEDALKKMSATGAGRNVVVEVLESNWMLNPYRQDAKYYSYKYNFAVHVAGADLKAQSSRFAALLEDKDGVGEGHNLFDMNSIRYRRVIESMFADPAIQQALR